MISEIADAREYSSDLARQLLDYSRPHATQPQIVNLNDTVSRIQQLLRRAIGEDVRLEIATSSIVLSDADVAYSFGLNPGDFACLTISDDGMGMDSGTVERIFDPYFTTKPPGKGTGLGLATVHDIVKHYRVSRSNSVESPRLNRRRAGGRSTAHG